MLNNSKDKLRKAILCVSPCGTYHLIHHFSLTGWVVINRRTMIVAAIQHPIRACNAGLAGKNPTKPCKTERTAMATPYCTVRDLKACFSCTGIISIPLLSSSCGLLLWLLFAALTAAARLAVMHISNPGFCGLVLSPFSCTYAPFYRRLWLGNLRMA